VDHTSVGNAVLAALPNQNWHKMRAHLSSVALRTGNMLAEAGQPIHRIHFPCAGLVSTVALLEQGIVTEMATVGSEGIVEFGAILGSRVALSTYIVQMPGEALVLEYDAFRRFREEISGFQRALLEYAQAFTIQALHSVACNASHLAQARAARWLLSCHDRSGSDSFLLTQDFLAQMLGVSRNIVNTIGRSLQHAGIIHYNRGTIIIRDRLGLEQRSCECYGIIRQAYLQRGFIFKRASADRRVGV
jgi:CRP-like cAMP-binding protein